MRRSYRVIVGLFRFVVRLFFRRVEVIGLEHLPKDGGGILVSWHPNGMVDPGLILTHFPMQVVFGARHGLFRVPVLGMMMRAIGTVPIYRAMDQKNADPETRRKANLASLDALANEVAGGSYSCLFPEGDSHDNPNLLELKTGAARFYYRARQLSPEGKAPVIIPVGLHYDSKRAFRSNALVAFHPPIELGEDLDVRPPEDEDADSARTRSRKLTEEIERVLREVVHATESWELHHLMHRARKLVRAERAFRAGEVDLGPTRMQERILGFARVWAGYYQRLETHPEHVEEVVEAVREYDEDLRALGIQDHELDRDPKLLKPWLALILVLQVLLVFFLMPPVLLVGYLVNGPTALLILAASKYFKKRKKDEATIKALLGSIAFPITWVGIGVLAARAHLQLHTLFPNMPEGAVMTGILSTLLAILGGAIAMRYLRVARETVRAVRVRLTRARRRAAIRRLKMERSELHDLIVGLAADLELPGEVGPLGRVRLPTDPGSSSDEVVPP